ncbi:MAG: ferrous iron transporter B [Clostridia bacterium]|nr:ferrous iron transporter B [Clostridia bacterium]
MATYVLVGNQNCGKTTLFNALTGANQHTGNWPGVTVERKEGSISGAAIQVTDLPGTYSLHPYSEEERVTRDVLLQGGYDGVINVVDAACMGRGLYLTMQLLALGKPVILAVNMMDEARRQGIHLDVQELAQRLHVPVVPLSARTREGMDMLIGEITHRPAANSAAAAAPSIPTADEIDRCYRHIDQIVSACVHREVSLPSWTERIDKLATHGIAGYLLLALILLAMLWLTFGPVGSGLADLLAHGIDQITAHAVSSMKAHRVSPRLAAFVADGILTGVGSVVTFMPTVLLLLFLMSLLEDSGYMARAAFLMDRPLRRIGLSGHAFIPLLMGFGCTVPAAMAVKSMPGVRDRWLTTLLLPFMSCSAKLPVYAMLSQAFFTDAAWLTLTSLYIGGIGLSAAAAGVYAQTVCRGDAAPLLMELPIYRLPAWRSVLRTMWEKAADFIRRALTIILLASVAVWYMRSHTCMLAWTDMPAESMLGVLSGALAHLLVPLGFGRAEIASALLTGVLAKESIISTLAVLLGCDAGSETFLQALQGLLPGRAAALSLLTFAMLYTPCVAAVASMARTLNNRAKAIGAALGQTGIAWGCAWLVYKLCTLVEIC